MNYLASKMQVLNLLGKGLSVNSLLENTQLTFDELCKLAQEYPELHNELKRWYKRYDFTVKSKEQDKPLETNKKPVKRAKKQPEQMVGG
jgi:hypothetical protein